MLKTHKHKLSIVVADEWKALLLKNVLPKRQVKNLKFYASNSKTASLSVGRNILVHEGCAVLIVNDAETLDQNKSEEKKALDLAALRQVSASGKFDVFNFLPALESIYFESKPFLERLAKNKITEEIMLNGKFIPAQTLNKLKLDDSDINNLRKTSQLHKLIAVIKKFT